MLQPGRDGGEERRTGEREKEMARTRASQAWEAAARFESRVSAAPRCTGPLLRAEGLAGLSKSGERARIG